MLLKLRRYLSGQAGPLYGLGTLTPRDVIEFARFLQGSQGDYGVQEPSSSFTALANDFFAALRIDLNFDEVVTSFEDGGSDMTANFFMARRSDNRYFSLELWWSLD